MSSAGCSGVVAVTATYRRPAELERLLRSLEASERPLHAVIVVDNAGDQATATAVARSALRSELIQPGSNVGCGAGLQLGERAAFEKFASELTHVWILDDDAVIFPQTLGLLLEAMEAGSAEASHPLVLDAEGNLGWFPGLLDRKRFRAIQERQTPEQFVGRFGSAPVEFSWAQGIALLVSRRVFLELGFHRADYWMRGEDLEFSLRITDRFRGLYVPAARVRHLPPMSPADESGKGEYVRHRAMLQNVAYTAIRLRHGWRIARTIPGNWRRFLQTWSWKPAVLSDAIGALWRGAVRGRPAGR